MSAPRTHSARVRVLAVELREALGAAGYLDAAEFAEAFTERGDVRDLLARRPTETTEAAGREHEPPLVARVLHHPSGAFGLAEDVRPRPGQRLVLDLRKIWVISSAERESAILASLLAFVLPMCSESSGVDIRARRELAARVAVVLRAALACPVHVAGGGRGA